VSIIELLRAGNPAAWGMVICVILLICAPGIAWLVFG